MSKRTGRFSKRAARWLVCCCLCVALPICSVPTLLAPLFVPAHFREFASVATVDAGSMAGWQDFRRVDHVSDSVIHVHEQLKLGRHHHDSTDASIVIVGAAAHNDGSDGVTLSAFAPIALATSDELSFRPLTRSERSERWVRSVRWLAPAACHFQSCDSRRLDRAPITWPLGPSRNEGPRALARGTLTGGATGHVPMLARSGFGRHRPLSAIAFDCLSTALHDSKPALCRSTNRVRLAAALRMEIAMIQVKSIQLTETGRRLGHDLFRYRNPVAVMSAWHRGRAFDDGVTPDRL